MNRISVSKVINPQIENSQIENTEGMNKNEVYAAIALALHEFKGNNVHDKETGIITIQEKTTQWNGYAMSMTEHP